MIYNERQYKITSKQIEELSNALETLDYQSNDWLAEAQYTALKSQISDLEAQITEYSLLKEGKIQFTECSDLSSLPRSLIQARISKGLTQKDLADFLQMQPQQVQRYEASNYMGASLSRLIDIAQILEINITESWSGSNASSGSSFFSWENDSNINWNSFPIKEMIKRGWIELKHKVSPSDLARDFFERAAGSQYATALHRKKFHGENTPNEYSLLAWQARVLEKARDSLQKTHTNEFELNDSWINELVDLSTSDNAPLLVKDFLASKGIILVVEPHLQGTYLDGAAMLLETGHPVVAMTLRHDRLDNFWFVLMHELGHVFLHLFDSLNIDFFDEEDNTEDDDLEREADYFAQNSLIPDDFWDLCLSRFSMTSDTVLMDAENLGIHPSIIAGRIRKERNSYTVLNDLVGQGSVRRLFGEEF